MFNNFPEIPEWFVKLVLLFAGIGFSAFLGVFAYFLYWVLKMIIIGVENS
jgi:hypothetical protein